MLFRICRSAVLALPFLPAALASMAIGHRLPAQSRYVLPNSGAYAKKAGEASQPLLFGQADARMRMLVRKDEVGFQKGRIVELAFRRAPGSSAFAARNLTCELQLAQTSLRVRDLPRDLDWKIAGSWTLGFQGSLALPKAPAGTGPRPFAARVKLQRPFAFDASAGHLALDMTVHGAGTSAWSVDAARLPAGGIPGSYRVLVRGCAGSNLYISATYPYLETAAPGRSLELLLYGANLQTKLLFNFIGVHGMAAPFPVELSALGMKGCWLGSDILALFAAPTGNPAYSYTRALARWDLPNDPRLFGATISSQWLEFDAKANTAGIVLSDAIAVTLGRAAAKDQVVQSVFSLGKSNRFGTKLSDAFAPIVELLVQ